MLRSFNLRKLIWTDAKNEQSLVKTTPSSSPLIPSPEIKINRLNSPMKTKTSTLKFVEFFKSTQLISSLIIL